MLDHVSIQVSDLDRSRAFYERALAPLGHRVMMEPVPGVLGFGSTHPAFWIRADATPSGPAHIAFAASDRAAVDAFHSVALQAGAADNGPAGPRPIYHEHYYGAFVLDPDGNNVEAVCHLPD